MRPAKFALIALGLLLAAAPLARAAEAAEAEVDEKDVIVLSDKNFNDTISAHKFVLVRPASPRAPPPPPDRALGPTAAAPTTRRWSSTRRGAATARWVAATFAAAPRARGCPPAVCSLYVLARHAPSALSANAGLPIRPIRPPAHAAAPRSPPPAIHPQALKAPFAEAATAVAALAGVDAVLGKLDATEQKDVAGRFEIKGYPTLKWFVDGEVASDFGGGRTAPEIVAWIKKKTGPPAATLADAAAFEAARKEGELLVLGYFPAFEGAEHAAFEARAAKTDDAAFAQTTDAAVAAAAGLKKGPAFAVCRNYPGHDLECVASEGHAAFAGKAPAGEKLAALLKAEKLPAYIEFSPAMSGRIFGSGVDAQVIVAAPGAAFAAGAPLVKALTEAAAKTRGKVVLVTSRVDEPTAEPVLNFFGLDKDAAEPQVVGFESKGNKKYAFPAGEKPTAKALIKFADAVAAGTAARMTKSEKEPESPADDDGVVTVTGNNFDKTVLDPTKDVFLEVYAPWCGHCKSLAPIWGKLAKRFASIDSVVIAKMDGTANEHPAAEASGFPTLLFFPATKGSEAVPHSGGRTLKDLTKFVKEHAKVAYELPKKAAKEEGAEAAEGAEAEAKEDGHDEL
jgi:protein disulfide-isomerase A1